MWTPSHVVSSDLMKPETAPRICVCMSARAQRWMYLEVWRWGLFLAGVAPVYWLSEAAVHAASLLVETKLFTVHNAMLMAMAVSIRVRTAPAC